MLSSDLHMHVRTQHIYMYIHEHKEEQREPFLKKNILKFCFSNFKITFIYLYMCTCVYTFVHVCQGVHMEAREQVGVSSLLTCVFQ